MGIFLIPASEILTKALQISDDKCQDFSCRPARSFLQTDGRGKTGLGKR
jgi:hypothetical protein